jgi:hypothetical protein
LERINDGPASKPQVTSKTPGPHASAGIGGDCDGIRRSKARSSTTWYSNLIDNYLKTSQSVTAARRNTMRFRLLLYQIVAEDNPDRMQENDRELDRVQADVRALLADALRQSPGRANEIKAAAALFDQAASSARPSAPPPWRATVKRP